jgi:Tetratricopeptide repeat
MSELDALGVLHGTDKSSSVSYAWDYLRHYEELFGKWRKSEINILEIGVAGASSLRMWLDFFEKARLVGIDIDRDCARFAGARVVIKIGSQENPGFLRGIAAEYPPTIVIDDGSHLAHHMIASFESLFPMLLPGGMYIFEDLAFHFEDGVGQMMGAKRHQGLAPTSIFDYLNRFVRARAANVSVPEGSWGFERYVFEEVDSITTFGGAVAVRKRAPATPHDIERDIAFFEKALERWKHDRGAKERYAGYLIRNGVNPERAATLLREVIAADPRRTTALVALTDVLVRLGRPDEAADIANQLVRIDGGWPMWWRKLAEVEFARKRFDLELAALRRLVELEQNPGTYERIGILQEQFGDLPAALAAARGAFELRPHDTRLRDRVSGLERRVRAARS